MYCKAVLLIMCLVLFTAVGRQMSEFEPSLPCVRTFFQFLFLFFFGVDEWVNGAYAMYCLQQQ